MLYTKAELRRAVRRGIKWLYVNRPGWVKDIFTVVDDLDMSKIDYCMIGLTDGPEFHTLWEQGCDEIEPFRLGFSLPCDNNYNLANKDYARLTQVWKEELEIEFAKNPHTQRHTEPGS